jgi:hypothetical protein
MDYKIATITMSTKLPDCDLQLTNIGKYLPIDSTILAVKYTYGSTTLMRGAYETTVYKKSKGKDISKVNKALFYNQITLVVDIGKDKQINAKLFNNGSLHLTGCKSIQDGIRATKLVYEKLVAMRHTTDTLLLARNMHGVLMDKDSLVYNWNEKEKVAKMIGCVKNDQYVINKKEYVFDKHTNMLISKRMGTKRTWQLLDCDGHEMGSMSIELMKSKRSLYKKTANLQYDFSAGLVHYNNEHVIGHINYTWIVEPTPMENKDWIHEVEYSCNPFLKDDYTLENSNDEISYYDVCVNCMNVYFKLDFLLNRQRLHDALLKMGYISKYNPESYSGIKFTYKVLYSDLEGDGHCVCDNKCTCTDITFLIFQSGNVIATGFKSTEQANTVTASFMNICNEVKDYVMKRAHF